MQALTRMDSCCRDGSKPNICLTIILSLSTVRVAGNFLATDKAVKSLLLASLK